MLGDDLVTIVLCHATVYEIHAFSNSKKYSYIYVHRWVFTWFSAISPKGDKGIKKGERWR